MRKSSSNCADQSTHVGALALPGWDPLAGHPGRREAPLDLSLGHIRTTEEDKQMLAEEIEVFRLKINTREGSAVLLVNVAGFDSINDLVKSLRKVLPMLAKGTGYRGYGPVPEESALAISNRSEDEQ